MAKKPEAKKPSPIAGAGAGIAKLVSKLDPKPTTTTKSIDKAKVTDPVRGKPPVKPFSEDDFEDDDGGPPARAAVPPDEAEEENEEAAASVEDEEGDDAEEEGDDSHSDDAGDEEGEGDGGAVAMPAVRCTFDQLRLILSRAALDSNNSHPTGTVVIGTAGEPGGEFAEQPSFDAVAAATFSGTSAGAFASKQHLDLEKVPPQDLPRGQVWVLSDHQVHGTFASPEAFTKWCETEPKPFGKATVTQHASPSQGVIKVSVGSGWLNQFTLTRCDVVGMAQ